MKEKLRYPPFCPVHIKDEGVNCQRPIECHKCRRDFTDQEVKA